MTGVDLNATDRSGRALDDQRTGVRFDLLIHHMSSRSAGRGIQQGERWISSAPTTRALGGVMPGDDEVQVRLGQVVDDRLEELGLDRRWLAGELDVSEGVIAGWLGNGRLPNTARIRTILEALRVDVLTFWAHWKPTPGSEPTDAQLAASAVPPSDSTKPAGAPHLHDDGVDTTGAASATDGEAAGSVDVAEHPTPGGPGHDIPSPRTPPEGRSRERQPGTARRSAGRSSTPTVRSGVVVMALVLGLATTVVVTLTTTRGPATEPHPTAGSAPAPATPALPASFRATAHSTDPPGLRVRTSPRLGDQFKTPVTFPEGASFEVTCSVLGAEVHDPTSSPPVSSIWYRLPDGRSYVSQVYASVVAAPVPMCPPG